MNKDYEDSESEYGDTDEESNTEEQSEEIKTKEQSEESNTDEETDDDVDEEMDDEKRKTLQKIKVGETVINLITEVILPYLNELK